MSSAASLSPQEERRFLAACAAAIPPLVLVMIILINHPRGVGFLELAAGIVMTLMVCSGPLLFVPVPGLWPVVGLLLAFVWIWRVRTSAIGDWGWKVHVAISAVYLFGTYGVLNAVRAV